MLRIFNPHKLPYTNFEVWLWANVPEKSARFEAVSKNSIPFRLMNEFVLTILYPFSLHNQNTVAMPHLIASFNENT